MENKLKFNNKKFRIMLVGDPHENQNETSVDDKNKIRDYLALQYAAVKKLKPDFVVLMGDNAGGNNPEELKKVLLRITKPYAENNIPFAFVLGNHDLECAVDSIETQYDIYRELPCCMLPDKASVNKYGDYNLIINSSDGNAPILNFWFMYSGNKADSSTYSNYDFVKKEQIAWYENKAEELSLANGKMIPAVNFQHIPVIEEFELLKECNFARMLTDGVTGQNEQKGKFYALDKSKATGYMGEAPCTPAYNSGQFASWKKTGDVFASFFGHDHMNDFAGYVDGIMLGQCKTAGFRPYGDGMMQGVRIIDFNENSPESIITKMVYYRELVGNNCLSIHGSEKILRDRLSVKLDVAKAVVKYTAPVIIPFVSLKLLKKVLSKPKK